MTTISRSACEPGGICYEMGGWRPLPPNVHHVEIPHTGARPIYVTWDQIMAARRERQANRLRAVRGEYIQAERRPIRIHVRYFDQDIYGGWHTYLDAPGREHCGGRGISHWVRGPFRAGDSPYDLLTIFPMVDITPGGLGISAPISNFEDWMPAFAAKYQRGVFGGRPRGVALCWAICSGDRIESIERP